MLTEATRYIITNDPQNQMVRGLIRKEMGVILPREDHEKMDGAAILDWVSKQKPAVPTKPTPEDFKGIAFVKGKVYATKVVREGMYANDSVKLPVYGLHTASPSSFGDKILEIIESQDDLDWQTNNSETESLVVEWDEDEYGEDDTPDIQLARHLTNAPLLHTAYQLWLGASGHGHCGDAVKVFCTTEQETINKYIDHAKKLQTTAKRYLEEVVGVEVRNEEEGLEEIIFSEPGDNE